MIIIIIIIIIDCSHIIIIVLNIIIINLRMEDSTVLRNVGVAFSHSILALLSLSRGISKLDTNLAKIESDLENNWVVVSEAIQTILRREGYPEPYELIKEATRGKDVGSQKSMLDMINNIPNISDNLRDELRAITPFNFIGVLPKDPFAKLQFI